MRQGLSRQTGIKRPFQTHQFAGGVLVSILILAPLLVGGVPQWVQLMMASLSTLGFGALLVSRTYRKQRMRAGMVVKLFVAMIALALVQLIPLPVSILEWVSPVTGGFAGEIATALNTPDAFFSISLHPSQTSFAALRYLTLLFVFILVVERVRESEKEGDALEAGVLILGAIVATLTVVQTLLKSGPMLGGYEPGAHWQARRVVSTFINENHQAAFFNLLTFVAFDSAFRAFGYRKRALYGFLGWGFAGLSLASGSHAGWWALLVGGIVYFVVQNKASFMRKHPRHFWGLLLGTLGQRGPDHPGGFPVGIGGSRT